MSKKKRNILIIVAVLLGIAIIGNLTDKDKATRNQPNRPVPQVQSVLDREFTTLNYEDKVKWIQEYASKKSIEYNPQLTRMVKNQFKYPEEVDFDFGSRPNLGKINVTLADEGIGFLSGFLKAKNAFGVKSKYQYRIRLIILPGTLKVDDITVNEYR